MEERILLNIEALGTSIRELRKQKGLTQNEFAGVLGVSFQAVSNWERGIAPPELENLINIAAYFGVLVDDLLRKQSDDLFLGIDGGGTKTEFVLVSSEGYVLKRLVKNGCNPNDIGYSAMLSILVDGIGDILTEFHSVKSVFCGIAGISTGDYAKRLSAELKRRYQQIDIQIKNDSHNLFALDERADMAVISGTGSVVFVKDGDSYKRLGGWGYLLDSAGSAYDFGRDVIREALHEEDMRENRSVMSRMLCRKLNVDTMWEHINTIYSEGKPYIASFASIVFDAFKQGDKKAEQIILRNTKALAELLNAGVKLCNASPVAIASGGLFEHYGEIMTEFIGQYSDVKLLISTLPPIYGACKKACSITACDISDEFYGNFKKTYGGIE